MALVVLAQPGQVLILTEGYRGNEESLRGNIFPTSRHALAVYSSYKPDDLEAFQEFAAAQDDVDDVRFVDIEVLDLLDNMNDVGCVTAGFFPGGNPFVSATYVNEGEVSQHFSVPLLVADLPPSVAQYLMKTIYTSFMSHTEGLDLTVMMGLVYAHLFHVKRHPDAFRVARLRHGDGLEWVPIEELDESVLRAKRRLQHLASSMSKVLGD